MKAMGGEIQARFCPQSDEERTAMIEAGFDLDRVHTQDDLIRATTASSPPPGSPTAHCFAASDSTSRAPAPRAS
jgi:hypothetical protein